MSSLFNFIFIFIFSFCELSLFILPRTCYGATCGCEPVVDTCGIINGTDIPPPPGEITEPEVYCNDCVGALPDHCGICGACQDPFFSCNYTVTVASGGLVAGNRLGSLASLSMSTVACGQYHKADPDIGPSLPSGIWTFADEPGDPCNAMQIKLTNISGDAIGHSSDGSPNFLLIGNPRVLPRIAHLFIKTLFPPYSHIFDFQDPCGGNSFGWDVAVDEDSGFAAVSDPRSHFSGSVWIFQITSPSLFQNITVGEKGWQFGYSIDMHDGELVVGIPGCDLGIDGAGCVYFYSFDGTEFVENIGFINSPFPFEDEGLGWRASTNGKWAFIGTKAGNVVHVYHRNATVWEYNTTLTEPLLSPNNRYGYAVHVTPDDLGMIADERFVNSAQSRGALFTYRRQGGIWQLWASYTDGGTVFNSHFGAAIDANEEFILVGIPGASPFGKCMLFKRDVQPCFGCDGNYNSCAMIDACGICGGNDATCIGCDGIALSNKTIDGCGVCGGLNDTCILMEPMIFNITCNDNQILPLNASTIIFEVCCNETSATNFTLNTFPASSNWTFDSSTGVLVYTPPLLLSGATALNVTACYVETVAVVPPECTESDIVLTGADCDGYVPPGPIITAMVGMEEIELCNTTLFALNIVNCTDCSGGGGVIIFDACGICDGDGLSCAGCDGIPNSGAELDYCGVCEGTNITCVDIFPLPFVAGPCNPFCIFMAHEPVQNSVVFTIISPPVYGIATISPFQGKISYIPPDSLMGLPPNDIMTIKGKDNHLNTDTHILLIPFSLFIVDECGLCGGDGSTCAGCDGVPNSGIKLDRCGVCGGDGSTCPGVRSCGVICYLLWILPWLVTLFILAIIFRTYRIFSSWCRKSHTLIPAPTPRPAIFYDNGTRYDLQVGLED